MPNERSRTVIERMQSVSADAIDGAFAPRRAVVASTVVDGEVVLVSGTDGVFYRLDPVASLIWTCLDGSGTADEIASDLAAELGAPASEVRNDVVAVSRLLGRLCFLDGVACDTPPSGALATPEPPAGGARRRLVDPPSG